eukprot:s2442_g14.t1
MHPSRQLRHTHTHTAAMARAFVYYWIPGDNDKLEHPNTFEVRHEGPGAKLKEIRACFPLPGEYHFRFKMKWESGAIWMDVTNEESMVPMFEDKVFAKAPCKFSEYSNSDVVVHVVRFVDSRELQSDAVDALNSL